MTARLTPITLIQGCLGLAVLGVSTRFRLKGPYWTWRTQTAFPEGKPAGGRAELIRLAIEYGAWSWRTRRLK